MKKGQPVWGAAGMPDDDAPIFCARCLAELIPGRGNFFVVRIQAVADPTPPELTLEDLDRDHRAQFEQLVREMADHSEQELLDQVYRNVTIHLCNRCFQQWIEHPAGQKDA